MHLPSIAVEGIISVYTGYEECLIQLLEAICGKGSSKIGNTLLELYMEQLQAFRMSTDIQNTDIRNTGVNTDIITDDMKRDILEGKIMRILEGGCIYNLSHALLLCTSFGFKKGQIYLYERSQLRADLVMRTYIEGGDDANVLKLLKKEGKKEHSLSQQALTYFLTANISRPLLSGEHDIEDGDLVDLVSSKKDTNDDDNWEYLTEALDFIQKEELLTPSQVLSILSSSPILPLEVALDYIQKTCATLIDDVNVLEEKIYDIRDTVDVLTINKNKDDSNNSDEVEKTSQEIAVDRNKWVNIRRAQIEKGKDQEGFYADLEASKDGFTTISSYFGKLAI